MPPRDISRRFFARPIGRSPFAPPPFRVSRWVYLVVAGWLIYALVLSESSFWHIAQLKHELELAQADTKQIKDETTRIEAQVKDPEERRFHAEEIARTQHGWAAPGEIVYRFRDGHVTADSTR